MSATTSAAPLPAFVGVSNAPVVHCSPRNEFRVERRANGEASSVMTSARAGADGSVGGSVGEAVRRWTDWVGPGVDKQPSCQLSAAVELWRDRQDPWVGRIRTTRSRPTDHSGEIRCCWSPSRLPDGILTIDAQVVHDAVQHLASPQGRAGERELWSLGLWGEMRLGVAQFLANLWHAKES
jgi:hypothetical protein